MADYCAVSLASWEPDSDPNRVVEYLFHDANAEYEQLSPSPSPRVKPHLKDHFQFGSVSTLDQHRLHASKRHSDTSEESRYCWMTIEIKPPHDFAIGGLGVASEAHNIEVYDARSSQYLLSVRGTRDIEDSEADDSIVHFMCHCAFEEPMKGIKIKFLSLGQRESFEIARVRLILESCDAQSRPAPGQTINMERLKRDVDEMGDTVSDRAKAFLTTLENFQKSKQGSLDEMRNVLLDKNRPQSADGQAMAGMTTLLTMFANTPGHSASRQPVEGSMVNNLLTQMMGSLAMQQPPQQHPQASAGAGAEGAGATGDGMYQFMQTMCSQVSQMRTDEQQQQQASTDAVTQGAEADSGDGGEAAAKSGESTGEVESRVSAKIEALVETRLTEVEQHITQQVDKRFQEIQQHMDSKLDAILALMQNKQS